MTIRTLLTALGAITVVACGRDAGSRTTVDSAGVSIITSTAPVWGDSAAWSIDSVPLLSIGNAADSGAVLLIGVSGVRLLDDGRIAIVSNDEKAVLYFDSNGRPSGRMGRGGSGVGEFRQVMLVASIHDSLLLWDYELDRATLVDPGGRIARTFSFTSTDTTASYGYGPAGQFADGSLLAAGRLGATTGEKSGVRRLTIPLRRASATGVVERPATTIVGNEQLVVSTARYVSAMDRPFGRRSVVAATGDKAIVSTGDRDEVMIVGRDGSIDEIWRISRPVRVPDSADVTAHSARLRAQAAQLPTDFATAMLDAIAEAGIPAGLPSFDQMMVDATGALWLRDDVGPVRRDIAAARWTVFDDDGRWLGSLTTPSRFVVHQVARDRVVGVWTDEDGVEQVRIYGLHR